MDIKSCILYILYCSTTYSSREGWS